MSMTSLGYSLEPPDSDHVDECEDAPGTDCICDELLNVCVGCRLPGRYCVCP